MFEKKEKQKAEQVSPQTDNKAKTQAYEFHVMPQKFRQNLGQKGMSSKKFGLILVGLAVIIIVIVAGVLYFLSQSQPGLPLNNQPAQNNDNTNLVNQNDNINVDNNINDVNGNANLNTGFNINANTNSNVNTNMNVNTNTEPDGGTNQPVINGGASPAYPSSLDTDNDELTDYEEENLYQSQIRLADTDEDGFLDGTEIMNGYSPLAGSGAKLVVAGLANYYTNPNYNYQILYPSVWTARPLDDDQSLQKIVFTSRTGEYIEIMAVENPRNLSLVSWFLEQSPNANLGELIQDSTNNKYPVLITNDKLTYYLMTENKADKIFIINYEIGDQKELNFLTTFLMMINSFKVVNPVE